MPEEIINVPLDKIRPNPYQPQSRIEIPDDEAEKFGLSILKQGLIQTPVCRRADGPGMYEMGDGWLRLSGYRWLIANGHTEYQEIPVSVRDLTDQQMADLVMEANTVRKDLSPLDLARFYKRYLDDFKITQTELAKLHNVSQGEIANTIRLLELPEDIQQKIISQEISDTHGRQLLRLNYNPELQQKQLQNCVERNLSVSQLSNEIAHDIYRNSKPLDKNDYPQPEFDTKPCEGCKSRQKLGQPYSDNRKTWRCLNPDCWEKKQEEAEQARVAKLAAEIAATKNEADEKGDGVLDLSKLTWRDYQELDSTYKPIDNPKECNNCPSRALGKTWEGSLVMKVCTNVKCFKEKEKVYQNKAAAKTKEEEKKLTERVKIACTNLRDESTSFELIVGYLLRHSRKDTRERFARMYGIPDPGGYFTSDDEVDTIQKTIALVLTLERYEGEKGVFQKMLAGLEGTSAELNKALDVHRTKHCEGCVNDNDNRTCRHLLRRYGEGWNDKCYHYEHQADEVPLPCDDCFHANTCDRSHFYDGGNGVLVCDMKARQSNIDEALSKETPEVPIPEGVRLAENVPDDECKNCPLSAMDHTIGLKFRFTLAGHEASHLVCIKDYRIVCNDNQAGEVQRLIEARRNIPVA